MFGILYLLLAAGMGIKITEAFLLRETVPNRRREAVSGL